MHFEMEFIEEETENLGPRVKRETENMVPRVKATESQNASLLKSHSPRAAGSSLSCSDHRHRFEAGHLLACT